MLGGSAYRARSPPYSICPRLTSQGKIVGRPPGCPLDLVSTTASIFAVLWYFQCQDSEVTLLITLDKVPVQEEGLHKVLHQVGGWPGKERDWEGPRSDEEVLLCHQSRRAHTNEDSPQKVSEMRQHCKFILVSISFILAMMSYLLRTAWTAVMISTGINWA